MTQGRRTVRDKIREHYIVTFFVSGDGCTSNVISVPFVVICYLCLYTSQIPLSTILFVSRPLSPYPKELDLPSVDVIIYHTCPIRSHSSVVNSFLLFHSHIPQTLSITLPGFQSCSDLKPSPDPTSTLRPSTICLCHKIRFLTYSSDSVLDVSFQYQYRKSLYSLTSLSLRTLQILVSLYHLVKILCHIWSEKKTGSQYVLNSQSPVEKKIHLHHYTF